MRGLKLGAALAWALFLGGCGGSSNGAGGGGGGGASGLQFSTYLGVDAFSFVRDVAVDSQGNVYAAGGSRADDLPTTSGTEQPSHAGEEDAFVVKFDPQGRIRWSTFLGGGSVDRAYAIELSPQGDVVIAGRAGAGFPVTAGSLQATFQGGTPSGAFPAQDGFVAKLDGDDGKLIWATYFGASVDQNIIRDIAVDAQDGSVYLGSSSDGGTYTTAVAAAFQNGHQSTRQGATDGVLAKLTADGGQLEWATFVGGSGDEVNTPSVRVDSLGNAVILYSTPSTDAETTAGAFDRVHGGDGDFYVAKFDIDGDLIWATFLGGSLNETIETHNLAVRSDDAVVVAGGSRSTDFPTSAGAHDGMHNGNGGSGTGAGTNYATDCVVAILNPAGSDLLAGTFFGGRFGEACEGVGSDSNGNVYVTGGTFSDDLPTTSGALLSSRPATLSAFVAVLSRDLTSLRYASYFGGNETAIGRDLAVHGEAHFVFGGEAGSGLPLKNAVRNNPSAGTDHGFVTDLRVELGPG